MRSHTRTRGWMSRPAETFKIYLASTRSTHVYFASPCCLVCLFCPHPSTPLPPRLLLPARGARHPPVSLSAERGVTARIPRRSPKDGVARQTTFPPPPPPLASSHSSRLARSVADRNALNLDPVPNQPR